jgi:hypothetical protein
MVFVIFVATLLRATAPLSDARQVTLAPAQPTADRF